MVETCFQLLLLFIVFSNSIFFGLFIWFWCSMFAPTPFSVSCSDNFHILFSLSTNMFHQVLLFFLQILVIWLFLSYVSFVFIVIGIKKLFFRSIANSCSVFWYTLKLPSYLWGKVWVPWDARKPKSTIWETKSSLVLLSFYPIQWRTPQL